MLSLGVKQNSSAGAGKSDLSLIKTKQRLRNGNGEPLVGKYNPSYDLKDDVMEGKDERQQFLSGSLYPCTLSQGIDDISVLHLGFILGPHTLELIYPYNTQRSLVRFGRLD